MQTFWTDLETKFEQADIANPCLLSKEDILFGRYKSIKYDMLNHAIMYAKFFLHKQYIKNKNPRVDYFMNFYKYILLVEREKYTEKYQLQTFFQRFGKSNII